VQPADYPKTQPLDIGRPVVAADIINHFVEFMDNDRVGAIANMHLHLADLKTVHSDECKKLAEMASTAVDYPKTGIK
jgi:RNA dependent RNA polymerase